MTFWMSLWLHEQRLADCQSHYMVLGLDNKQKGEHYFLCIDSGCYAHLIYFVNLHVYVLFIPGSKWTDNCHNLAGCY